MTLATVLLLASAPVTGLGIFLALKGMRGDPEGLHQSHGAFAVANWMSFCGQVLDQSPFWAAFNGLLAALMTWWWWKNRRKGRGRKALKELGEKSRARVAALVERMTPSPIPSPGGA